MRPAEIEVIDQADQVFDQVVVRDRAQPGAVVGVLAGIVEHDRPESPGEADQRRRVGPVRRGQAGDEDERRPFAEGAVGHPVVRRGPVADLGPPPVVGDLGEEVDRRPGDAVQGPAS